MFKKLIDKVSQQVRSGGGNAVSYQVPLENMQYAPPRTMFNKGGKAYKNVKDMESKCQSRK